MILTRILLQRISRCFGCKSRASYLEVDTKGYLEFDWPIRVYTDIRHISTAAKVKLESLRPFFFTEHSAQ